MTDKPQADLEGDGAIAQGDGATAVGAGGVLVQGNVHTVTVTYQATQIEIPAPEAVAAHRKALRHQLEERALRRWGSMATYIREEGAALPLEASPHQTGRLGPREPLIEALRTAQRLLVLGEPGSGKSVSLQRLAWEVCAASEPLVPVLLPLFRYDGAPLWKWIRSYLQQTGHLRLDDDRALIAFLNEGAARCFFLFDGLNEVPPDHRDRLRGELTRWMWDYPSHTVVLTSRPHDDLWRQVQDEVARTLVVRPITDEQAQAYLHEHLDAQGTRLYERLDERLQEMARTPLLLWLIKEAGAAGESLPGNRGELYERFVSRMLRRDTTRRRMDAEIPERDKQQALAHLAYHLGLGERLVCAVAEAVDIVAHRFDAAYARDLVGACRRHGLLAGEDEVWFAPHQTIQEYFMALALRERWQDERARPAIRRWWRGVQRRLGRFTGDVLDQARDDWWMETFVQLAGLVDDADQLVKEVSTVRPWLALWCVGEGRDISQETQALVEERSVHVLHSERLADRRRAVAALARIRNPRVIDPLLWAAGDQDPEVWQVAVQALTDLGDPVPPRALQLLDNQDFRWGTMRCACGWSTSSFGDELTPIWEAKLGLPLIFVPAGPFLMGSDPAKDPLAYQDEFPQHTVTLPGYWIGRTPVTVAQFRAFARDDPQMDASRLPNGRDDYPVIGITWHEAIAYCHWLGERSGLSVAPPSEAEWEKAARGTDGRIYPWGDEKPDPQLCNLHDLKGAEIVLGYSTRDDEKLDPQRYNSNNPNGFTHVGRYSPQGDSPYGCVDMAGNVWEWTRGLSRDYPYDPMDGREDIDAGDDVRRVLRGGAFYSDQGGVRCAFRNGYNPYLRYFDLGFRLDVSPYL